MWTLFVTLFLFHFHRLLNSFAEEQAIEDAIYYLGEALRKDVIDLDVFLKVSMKKILYTQLFRSFGFYVLPFSIYKLYCLVLDNLA